MLTYQNKLTGTVYDKHISINPVVNHPSPDIPYIACPEIYLSLSFNALPASMEDFAQVPIPFGGVIQPLATPFDESVLNSVSHILQHKLPVIPSNHYGVIRCERCRAYLNPFVTDVTATSYTCSFCFCHNKLPGNFQRSKSVELLHCALEINANSDYFSVLSLFIYLISLGKRRTPSDVLFCR